MSERQRNGAYAFMGAAAGAFGILIAVYGFMSARDTAMAVTNNDVHELKLKSSEHGEKIGLIREELAGIRADTAYIRHWIERMDDKQRGQ